MNYTNIQDTRQTGNQFTPDLKRDRPRVLLLGAEYKKSLQGQAEAEPRKASTINSVRVRILEYIYILA